jgi:hypothetical protein
MECFYLDFHPFPPVTRWQDRHRIRVLEERLKGGPSSPTHKGGQYTPLISDLVVVAQLGNAPTQGPHLLCLSSGAPLVGI